MMVEMTEMHERERKHKEQKEDLQLRSAALQDEVSALQRS